MIRSAISHHQRHRIYINSPQPDAYSKKFIVIYTWDTSPELKNDGYQKYRDFTYFSYIIENSGFTLIKKMKPHRLIDKYGAMWIYKTNENP